MFVSDWSKHVPGKSIDECIQFLNDLSWNIILEVEGNHEIAYAGDRLLVQTDTKRELEAFLFGMTISLAVLSDDILEDIKRLAAE